MQRESGDAISKKKRKYDEEDKDGVEDGTSKENVHITRSRPAAGSDDVHSELEEDRDSLRQHAWSELWRPPQEGYRPRYQESLRSREDSVDRG
jgi:hypothetical protein